MSGAKCPFLPPRRTVLVKPWLPYGTRDNDPYGERESRVDTRTLDKIYQIVDS